MLRATGLRALAGAAAAAASLAGAPAWAQVQGQPQAQAKAPAAGDAAAPAPAAPKGAGSEVGLSMDPSQGPFAKRGGSLPPVIGNLQSEGIKLVALGDEGAKGYLGEAANGRYQAFYATPDGEHVVAGLMFRTGGANVTTRQIAAMMGRFNEAARATPDGASVTDAPSPDAPAADPGIPFVDWMRGNGAKLTPFLDRDGGVDGYLVEAPSKDGRAGKMQSIYVMPDGRHAVAGVLIRRGGTLVTGLQVAALQQRYMQDKEAKDHEQASVVDPSSPRPPSAPPAGLVVPPVPAAAIPPVPGVAEGNTAGGPAPVADVVAAPVAAEPAAAPAPRPAAPAKPAEAKSAEAVPAAGRPGPSTRPESDAAEYLVTASDREEFVKAAHRTVWFPVGLPGAPVVWMLADPQCPFCHETWKQLKPIVFAGRLQVRVILIAGLNGSDPLARSILSRGEPTGNDAARAWLEGEGSIANVPIKPPPADGVPSGEAARRFVAFNSNFANQYKINRTPFLFYEAPGDRLYASQGMPSDFGKFLAAVR